MKMAREVRTKSSKKIVLMGYLCHLFSHAGHFSKCTCVSNVPCSDVSGRRVESMWPCSSVKVGGLMHHVGHSRFRRSVGGLGRGPCPWGTFLEKVLSLQTLESRVRPLGRSRASGFAVTKPFVLWDAAPCVLPFSVHLHFMI